MCHSYTVSDRLAALACLVLVYGMSACGARAQTPNESGIEDIDDPALQEALNKP